jgi:hypothetical protein
VEKKQDGESLSLTYVENGEDKQASFDLVVILTKPKVSPELVSLSKKLEQDII